MLEFVASTILNGTPNSELRMALRSLPKWSLTPGSTLPEVMAQVKEYLRHRTGVLSEVPMAPLRHKPDTSLQRKMAPDEFDAICRRLRSQIVRKDEDMADAEEESKDPLVHSDRPLASAEEIFRRIKAEAAGRGLYDGQSQERSSVSPSHYRFVLLQERHSLDSLTASLTHCEAILTYFRAGPQRVGIRGKIANVVASFTRRFLNWFITPSLAFDDHAHRALRESAAAIKVLQRQVSLLALELSKIAEAMETLQEREAEQRRQSECSRAEPGSEPPLVIP